jgi:hypothetical protein
MTENNLATAALETHRNGAKFGQGFHDVLAAILGHLDQQEATATGP